MARPAERGGQTRLLGPRDQGLVLELEEFEAADFEPGFRYDLVEGRLEVSPEADLPHDLPAMALCDLFGEYGRQHAGAIGYRSPRARVFPRARKGSVGPDLALFLGLRADADEQRWQELEPILVVEVLSPGDVRKDLVRNRDCYQEVPSIREYWIVDPRLGRARTTLRVLARAADGGWTERLVPAGGQYESPLFPGLVVDLARADMGLGPLIQRRLDRVREEGQLLGARRLLDRLLGARFGALPEQVSQRVEGADLEQLERWAARTLDARSLNDVFRP